jgi:hypothetical protein
MSDSDKLSKLPHLNSKNKGNLNSDGVKKGMNDSERLMDRSRFPPIASPQGRWAGSSSVKPTTFDKPKPLNSMHHPTSFQDSQVYKVCLIK